jgi:hypothetical protein
VSDVSDVSGAGFGPLTGRPSGAAEAAAAGAAAGEASDLEALEELLAEAYFDRNLLALALARLALALGCHAGLGEDPAAPDWPVVYAELPNAGGQVSYHLPADTARAYAGGLPAYEGSYDGHTTGQKRLRLARFLTGPGGA